MVCVYLRESFFFQLWGTVQNGGGRAEEQEEERKMETWSQTSSSTGPWPGNYTVFDGTEGLAGEGMEEKVGGETGVNPLPGISEAHLE